MQVTEQMLYAALGAMLVANGALLRYIFTAHTSRIDEVQAKCDREVKALSEKLEREVEILDQDIKNVGSKLAEQLERLTRELFEKIDANRRELNTGIQGVNHRLDALLSRQTPGSGAA